jgi:photosystem II protein PsbQ
MRYFRSILSLLLVGVMTLLVSCGNGDVAKVPPTYTPELVTQIQRYAVPIEQAREELPRLGNLIQERDWDDVESFIHGPLGELRHSMSYVARTLLPEDQPGATEMAKDISAHFERIDAAAKAGTYTTALENYNEVVADIETFLSLIPETSEGA